MSKFTCLVLCAVAVSLSRVNASEDRAAFHEAIKPFAKECAKEHEVSEDDIKKAKETHNLDILKPCFVGCIFKKFELINDKGEYDSETTIAKMRKIVKNDDHFASISKTGKKCESVNAEAVSDGDAGCERAVLLAKCFIKHKTQFRHLIKAPLTTKQPAINSFFAQETYKTLYVPCISV